MQLKPDQLTGYLMFTSLQSNCTTRRLTHAVQKPALILTLATSQSSGVAGCASSSSVSSAAASALTSLEVSKASLPYQLSGSGSKTLVLMHEMQISLESWDDMMPGLQPGHHIPRYDLRGFGQSEKFAAALPWQLS